MAEVLLEVENLRVDYEDLTAVNGISFSVEAGMVYGLIGPNGAGKTSTIRAISTLVEPTYGRMRIKGIDVELEPQRALVHLAYMPDFPPVYEDLKVWEFLDLFASAYRIPISERSRRIEELLETVNLVDKREHMTGTLSRGMRQRLFLAKTLLHDPDVLLLDEPASGLDPVARDEFAQVLRNLGSQGKAVVVSSHILTEMDTFCNSVGIMDHGEMKASGRIDEILAQMTSQNSLQIVLTAEREGMLGALRALEGVVEAHVDGRHASVVFDGDEQATANLLKQLVEQGFPVMEFRPESKDLGDIFRAVASGEAS